MPLGHKITSIIHHIKLLINIRKDDTITQHRKQLEIEAHCRPYNHSSIGICYEGRLDEHGKPCDTRTP